MRNVEVAVLWRNSPAMTRTPSMRITSDPDDAAEMTFRRPSLVVSAGPAPGSPADRMLLATLRGTKASAAKALR